MKALTPTQSARAYAIRTFGPFLVTMSQASEHVTLTVEPGAYPLMWNVNTGWEGAQS